MKLTWHIMSWISVGFLTLILLTACGNARSENGQPSLENGKSSEAAYVPGEILVKFKPDTPKAAIEEIGAKLQLETIETVTPPNLKLMKIVGGVPVEDMVKLLQAEEMVEYAEPNYIRTLD